MARVQSDIILIIFPKFPSDGNLIMFPEFPSDRNNFILLFCLENSVSDGILFILLFDMS